MLTRYLDKLHQSRHASEHGTSALPGCWKLAPGRAITLQPGVDALLRIEQGRVWVTLDGPRLGRGHESGDLFLEAGQQLLVHAGQRLVFEPWGEAAEVPVYFVWAPAPVASARTSRWPVALSRLDFSFGFGGFGLAGFQRCLQSQPGPGGH